MNTLGKAEDDPAIDAIYAVNPLGTMVQADIKEDGRFYLTLKTSAAYLIVFVSDDVVMGTLKMSGCGLSSAPLTYTPGAKSAGTAEFEDGELTSGDIETINLGEVTWDGEYADASCEDFNLSAEQEATISLLDTWLSVYSNFDVDQDGVFDFTQAAPGITLDSDLEYGCDIKLSNDITSWLNALGLAAYANRFCYKMYNLSLRTYMTSAYNLNNLIGDDEDDYPDPAVSNNRFQIYFGGNYDENYRNLDELYLFSSEPIEFGYSSYDVNDGLESPYTYAAGEAIEAYDYEGSNYPFLHRDGSLESISKADYYISLDSVLDEGSDLLFSNVEAPNLDYSFIPQIKLITNADDEVTSVAWKWMIKIGDEPLRAATEKEVEGMVLSFLFLEDDKNGDGYKEQCNVYSFSLSYRDNENAEYLNGGSTVGNVIVSKKEDDGEIDYTCSEPDGINSVIVSDKISEGVATLDDAITPLNTKDIRIQVNDISGNRSIYEWSWHGISKWYEVTVEGGSCPLHEDVVIGSAEEANGYYVDGGWQGDANYKLKFTTDVYGNTKSSAISCEDPMYGHVDSEEVCDGGCEVTLREDGYYTIVLTGCQHDGNSCNITLTGVGMNTE